MSAVAVYLIFSMLAVLWFDVTRYIIPNWLVGLMLVSYPVAVGMAHAPVDWKMALAAMGIVLVAGYVIFALKWMGGGDIKLITACALWVGYANLLDFVFLVSISGGVFSLGLWGLRKLIPLLPKKFALPRILREGEPVPYGVAIAFSFLIMIKNGQVPALM